jgi:hypothetical protein
MEKLTLDQVRDGLDWLQTNYQSLMDNEEYGIAQMLVSKIEAYQIEIIGRITSEDPYTTAADIRYFENFIEIR